jgi:hypothetical protein
MHSVGKWVGMWQSTIDVEQACVVKKTSAILSAC